MQVKQSNSKKLAKTMLPTALLAKVSEELYKAGMNVYKIAEALSQEPKTIRELMNLSEKDSFPKTPLDSSLCDKILYDSNIPVASEVIISNEKERFTQYSIVEAQCLEIMQKLLTFYGKEPEGDLKTDAFKANLASSFIKATQQCRQELLQKYAVDTANAENKQNIKIEFVE